MNNSKTNHVFSNKCLKKMGKSSKLSAEEYNDLIEILKARFETNMNRHAEIEWQDVQAKLDAESQISSAKLMSLIEMEKTSGEPDVVGFDETTGEYIFFDCSTESPKGRRNLCYDRVALVSRRNNKPEGSALDMAENMGIEILTEDQYRELQKLGYFDLKTSSWVKTPPEIRKRGGAIFCDRRYNHVFMYHNGADSYYGARGFRGMLKV